MERSNAARARHALIPKAVMDRSLAGVDAAAHLQTANIHSSEKSQFLVVASLGERYAKAVDASRRLQTIGEIISWLVMTYR